MNQKIELLSPAKNLECGIAAVNCGADAVYIGAPKFGARAVAGNTLHDIEKLINYAHPFGVKIFATLNTILYDNELEEAQKLIHQLYNIGCDALIVQDLGILKLDIPPIALHASTQTDNRTVEKVQFLQKCGFERIVLARETPLELIEKIYKQTLAELEVFVHGALCVSYSGQCYMSYANCERSANRGECAQYCRLPYSLQDANGNILLKNKHLLSLKDLNRANFLEDLINAGNDPEKVFTECLGFNTFVYHNISHTLEHKKPKPTDIFSGEVTDYTGRSAYMQTLESEKAINYIVDNAKVKEVEKKETTKKVTPKKVVEEVEDILWLSPEEIFLAYEENKVRK